MHETLAEPSNPAPTVGAGAGAAHAAGAALISAVAAESIDELRAGMQEDSRVIAAAQARLLVRQGEFERRQAFLEDGATSLEAWTAECCGVSPATARAYRHVAQKAGKLPHLVGSMSAGEVSFDKLRAIVDVATPGSDRELCDQAEKHSVRDLTEIARTTAARARPAASASQSRSEHDSRYLRFNDDHRTISAQLPTESYAEAKACIRARAGELESDGTTPLDQRNCDAFTGIIRSAASGPGQATRTSPVFVVAHVPLHALVDDARATTELAGELEIGGLIDTETVRRIACDATIAVAVDDDVGHTMYEGRAARFATATQRREVMRRDRHCRFPGCTNVTFAEVHHVVPWKPGGRTDLPNLALLCEHHHGVVHRNGWAMTGDANEELTITSPKGRITTSRPSPLWSRVSVRRGPPSR